MMPHSSFEPIVGFLRAMNKAWRRREMRHCERLRAAFQDRLDEVVRKTQHDQPMEVVRKNAEIARLKKQLSDWRGTREPALQVEEKGLRARAHAARHRRRTLEKMSMALSKDQLLEASLHTVEKLSKEIVKHSPTRGKGAGGAATWRPRGRGQRAVPRRRRVVRPLGRAARRRRRRRDPRPRAARGRGWAARARRHGARGAGAQARNPDERVQRLATSTRRSAPTSSARSRRAGCACASSSRRSSRPSPATRPRSSGSWARCRRRHVVTKRARARSVDRRHLARGCVHGAPPARAHARRATARSRMKGSTGTK